VLLLISSQVAASPKSSFADRGWREYFSGDIRLAQKIWERSLRGRGRSPLSWLGLSLIEESHGDLPSAYRHISSAIACLVEEPRLKPHEYIVPLEVYAIHLCSLAPFADGVESAQRTLSMVLDRSDLPFETRAQVTYLLVSLLRSQGRLEEAEALCDSMGFIRDFLVIGPFDSPEQSGWQTAYPPETEFIASGEYQGKRGFLSWSPVSVAPKWGYVNLANQLRPQQDATAYLSCFVRCPTETPVRLWMGYGGAAKLWVNRRLILADSEYHPFWMDQLSADAVLSEGTNQILVKVCSDEDRGWGVMLRITDPQGDPHVAFDLTTAPDEFTCAASEAQTLSASDDRVGELPVVLRDDVDESSDPVERALRHLSRAYLYRLWNLYHRGLSPDLEEVRKAESLYSSNPLIEKMLASLEKDNSRRSHALQKAIQSDPYDVEAMMLLVSLYQNELIDEAADSLISTLSSLARDYAPGRIVCGNDLERRGSSLLARQAYLDAANSAPNWYRSWYLLGMQTSNLMSRMEALPFLERAVLCDKSLSEPARALFDLHRELGNQEEAESLANASLEQRPDDLRLALDLGRWYAAGEEHGKAEQWLNRAMSISPNDPECNTEMGHLRERRGEMTEAIRYWSHALQIRPNDAQLQEYLAHNLSEGADYYAPFELQLQSLDEPDIHLEEANIVCLADQQVRRVYPDGTSRRTVHQVNRVVNSAGIRQAAFEAIYYVPSREDVVVHTARVITKTGQQIFAPEPQVRSALDLSGVGSGIYSDYDVMIVSFDGVEKDALVELKYEIRENQENLYADYFGDIFYFGSYDPTVLSEYVLIFPKHRKLHHIFVPNGSEQPDNLSVQEEGDTCVYRWHYKNLPSIRREPMMPAVSEMLPYLKVSTFSTWDEMASWYWDLSRESLRPDTTVSATARQLITDPHATASQKLNAVFRYVSNEIRYLGLEFGVHGYKPHGAGHVNRMQYGDCKDKAGLAISLLKELGVPAQLVLLRTVDKGRIDLSLPSLGLFNHAIFRASLSDLTAEWFDGTADYTALGELPSMDQGAQVLVIHEGGRFTLEQIPISPPSANLIKYRTELVLSPEGNASGRRRASFHGLFNRSIRAAYQNDAKNPQIIEQQFGSAFPGSLITDVLHSDFSALSPEEYIEFSLELPRFAHSQNGALRFSACLFPERLTEAYAPLTTRRHQLVNHGLWQKERTLTLTLPPGSVCEEIPKDFHLDTPFGEFKRTYRHGNSKIIYEETLVFKAQRVGSQDYGAFRGFCASVDREQKSEVVLRPDRQ
ncbi:MAG TPA: DUF3857 domain-containing protein, partial [bacterium]|nr:DUF3857 domain-containing protein [bacterium]